MVHLLILLVIGFSCGYALFTLSYQFLYAPAVEKTVLGIKMQGVLPRLQHQLAERLGNEVAAFVHEQDLAALATDESVLAKVYSKIESNLADTLSNRIAQKSKVLDFLVTDRIQNQMSDFVMTELKERLPEIISTYVKQTKERADVSSMVAGYVKDMDTKIWRELLEENAANLKRQFSFAGGAFGTIITLLLLAAQNILVLIS